MQSLTCVLMMILSILIIWNIYLINEFPESMVVSALDGHKYNVKQNMKDQEQAADILARLNNINNTLIAHLKKKYMKETYISEIDFLHKNYNPEVLSEHIPRTTANTSYVLNKGDAVKLCLRNPKNNYKFHDFNTLTFVNLHELSHLLDRQWGHNFSFWKGFAFILKEAVSIGLYTPVDYSKFPTDYCGIVIYNNPYFNKKYDKVESTIL
jgi:hypothetical protein